ncbi:MAG: curli production assembly/transport component CsgF [Saprospiraceae bacterium]
MRKFILLLVVGCFACGLQAQDMVYKPKNPAFGGETFNYNWLLSSAQAQNLIEDPEQVANDQSNTLDDFAENLNRQLLNQLSRQLVTAQFGEEGLEEGNYTFGDFQIDVTTGIEGLIITVFDASIGEQTQVIIPFF